MAGRHVFIIAVCIIAATGIIFRRDGLICLVADKSKEMHSSSAPAMPFECYNEPVWNGTWDLPEKLKSRPGAKEAAKEDLAMRYHSNSEATCAMTDLLKLSVDEVVRGHLNDKIERDTLTRLKGVRGKYMLQIGTSVDHRNLRAGCPLFGTEREPLQRDGITIMKCSIPLLNFDMLYVYNGALTKDHVPVEEQMTLFQSFSATLKSHNYLDDPAFVVLAGIEWDLKWYKDNKAQIDWQYTKAMITSKVDSLLQYYSNSDAIFLRTQPFAQGLRGDSLGPKSDFEEFNQMMRDVVRDRGGEGVCGGLHIADMAKMSMFDGKESEAWSDGIHPSNWVSVQYLSILLNVMSLLGEECSGAHVPTNKI